MYDLIIIGAGPAGLAAALYATRKRLNYLVLSRDLGGKTNYSVAIPEREDDQTIRADELVTIYRSRLEYLRHSYRLTGVKRLDIGDHFSVETDDGSTLESRSVIVASGTHMKKLDVPGEMEFLSRALGYSSISYSHLFARKRVFVAGDTNRVLGSALELSIHAQHVTVGLLAGGRFDEALVSRLSSLENVEVLSDTTIREFSGDEFARTVEVEANGSKRTIEADGFFVEPEPRPNTSFLPADVSLAAGGFIEVNGSNMTSVPGLFAAGDVTGNGYEQVLVSLGEGAKAVLSAYRYLLENGLENRD
ncbi:MAG: FAD-dependent oxidoreductase [Spirochaetota bacterium]